MFHLNINLISVALTVITIGSLGFVAFLNNRKSISNKTFLFFSITAVFYSIINYLSYQFNSKEVTLWLLRFVLFSSVWYAYFLFQFLLVFPKDKYVFSKLYKKLITPSVAVISIVTLTPLTFIKIDRLAPVGFVSNPVRGFGVTLFGITTFLLVISGIVFLWRNMVKTKGQERKKYGIVLLGTVLTYILIIIFNMISPLLLNDLSYIPYVPAFTLPFILLTSYAIVRYRLFNIKVITTELLTFSLWIFLLIRLLLSNSLGDFIVSSLLLGFTILAGIFLIKAVLKEIDQRERLEKITKELEIVNSQLEVANVELTKLDKVKSEFISVASHQLRTPLTVVKGYVSMILEGSYGKITGKVKDPLTKVQISNQRLVELVDDLLNISRIESGRQNYEFKNNDIVALVTEVYDNFKIKAEEKKLKLIFEKPFDTLTVFCDGKKLHEVIMNYVSNAVKYSDKGTVSLSLEKKGDETVTFKVKDNGMGITKENMSMLFKKFSRGKGTYLVQTEGTGLGLYVAKKIIEVHEGRVWAESQGNGKGAAFFFTIPIKGPKKLPETNVDTSKAVKK